MSAPLGPLRCHSDLSHPQARGGSWGACRAEANSLGGERAAQPKSSLATSRSPPLPYFATHTCSRYACSQCPLVLCIPVSLSCVSSGSDFMCCFRVCAYGLCLRAAALYLVSLAWHSRWQVFCQCLQDVLGDFLLVVCRFVFTLKSQFCCSIC